MVGGMGAAGDVIDQERFFGGDLVELSHPADGVVGHGRGEIPARLADVGIDGRGVAEQVRLPLAGVTADEPVEILEAHARRPLVERPGLARHEGRRVVILAKPRGGVAVLQKDPANRAVVLLDDRVIARETRGQLRDVAEAGE